MEILLVEAVLEGMAPRPLSDERRMALRTRIFAALPEQERPGHLFAGAMRTRWVAIPAGAGIAAAIVGAVAYQVAQQGDTTTSAAHVSGNVLVDGVAGSDVNEGQLVRAVTHSWVSFGPDIRAGLEPGSEVRYESSSDPVTIRFVSGDGTFASTGPRLLVNGSNWSASIPSGSVARISLANELLSIQAIAGQIDVTVGGQTFPLTPNQGSLHIPLPNGGGPMASEPSPATPDGGPASAATPASGPGFEPRTVQGQDGQPAPAASAAAAPAAVAEQPVAVPNEETNPPGIGAQNAHGANAGGNSADNAHGANAGGNSAENAHGANAGGTAPENAHGANAGGDPPANAHGANAGGNPPASPAGGGNGGANAGGNPAPNAGGANAGGNGGSNAGGANAGANGGANSGGANAGANGGASAGGTNAGGTGGANAGGASGAPGSGNAGGSNGNGANAGAGGNSANPGTTHGGNPHTPG